MKKAKTMTAVSLRTILVIALLITIAASCLGFYQAQGQLREFAVTVGQIIGNSKSGTTSPDGLIALQQQLAARQTSIDKAASVTVAGTGYQSQAIKDLTKYATDTGITITNYTASDVATTATATTEIFGIKSKYLTITLQNPVKMNSLVKFLSLVETNLPKMQLTGISLSQADGNSMVSVDPLTIGVYTK